MRTPVEADFDVTSIDQTQVEVTFGPTESHYSFMRGPSGELLSIVSVRHAKTRGLNGRPDAEVLILAKRIAEQASRSQ